MLCTNVFEIYVQEHSEFTNPAQNLFPYTMGNWKYLVKLQNTQHFIKKEKKSLAGKKITLFTSILLKSKNICIVHIDR